MPDGVSRADLLRGRFKQAPAPIRPPGALAEARFVAACTRCDACVAACPEGIIVRGANGFPEIDFSRGGCDFCGRCATACDTGALDAARQPAWGLKATVDANCLSVQGVMCRLCEEQCEPRAIRFRLAYGGYALPEIDAAHCTGCGVCVAACPSTAIRVAEPSTNGSES